MTEKTTARTVSGLVLPWNTPGLTSGGRLQVKAGAVTYPDDLKQIKLLRDHSNTDGYSPVGYATAAEARADGLHMSFRIGETADGDVALKDVSEGIRDALSVELVNIETDGDTITAGHLTAVALVAIPAFASARVDTTATADAEAVVFAQDECHLTTAALDTNNHKDLDDTAAGKPAEEQDTEKGTEMSNQTSATLTTAARPAWPGNQSETSANILAGCRDHSTYAHGHCTG